MNDFRAFQINEKDGAVSGDFASLNLDDLSAGDVVVEVSHSTINYKDALAATGVGRILRSFPLVGGIDLAGTVISSDSEEFSAGDMVLVNGCGLGETRDGGYAEYARVPAEAVVPIPAGLTAFETMQIGTAGFTAALAI
ncbi:MAG: alcohol dehydrogenase catalytic domain-containing protein, partial [Woeseiaceae bacterium]